jgi:hypothetical protein
MIFALPRPYKEKIVNTFAIMNEAFLFIEGCYLFVFLQEDISPKTQMFYGWIVIGIVICQVLVNMGIIIPSKLVETYYAY